jgi:imidazolonepropionase-like amidohydrolase
VIEAGKRADIIAVDGDPLKDVHALQRGSPEALTCRRVNEVVVYQIFATRLSGRTMRSPG